MALGCALFVLVASVVPAAAAIVRQPYLQLVTPSSITIVWRTDLNSADNSQVKYGTVSGSLTQTATGTAVTRSGLNVKDHIVTITGLTAATKYFYNVGTGTDGIQGGGTTNHFFVTAPPVGSATPIRAWVLGDSGNASVNQRNVRDAMLTETALNPPAPNLILHMGDIAYESGTDAEFTSRHFAIYQDILRQTPLWPTLGNHEALSVTTSLGIGPYYEAHVLPTSGQAGGVASGTEAYYAFDYANVHFIVLDSMDSSRTPGSPMVTWLQNDLASTGQEWVIAFWHHPPYSKGHDSDNAADSGGRLIDMREKILPILEAGGVDLVLAGHSHAYERSYLIDGAYGYGTAPNFATPSFNTLLADGHILDAGNGNPSGTGAYQKSAGGVSHDGTVYVVAGHGGKSIEATGSHPVMTVVDLAYGSVLLDITGSSLTFRNLRAGGAITDTVAIQKSLPPPSSLTISNLTVASGQSYIVPASGLQAGGTVYIDRAYTFTTVPASVQGATYIRTANNDKTATTPTFLSFTVNQPVSVLVAHDVRLTPKPSWLSTFTDTGTNLVTSDTSLRLFSRSFPAGTITLGGNASGGSGSMYAVIIQPQGGGGPVNQAPNGVINTPSGAQTIQVGQTVTFTGTGTDPEPNLPLTHRWTFGAGSGIADRTVEDPGAITFTTAGVFTVTYTVTDALGLTDPTPATVQVTVQTQGTGFTAYNDLAWGTGQLEANITKITSPVGNSGLPSSGILKDFTTGLNTGVTLAVTGGEFIGSGQATLGANPTMGDAFTIFNGKVSTLGVISYVNQITNSLQLNFSGLNPSKTYDLSFFAHRDFYGWDRASLVTLSGQDAFTNTSSVASDNPSEVGGVIFSGPSDTSTRLPADNDKGYVARFSNIEPGSDGEVVLTISFDGNSASQYTGKYGSAIRLMESSDGGGPVNQAPNGVINTPSGAQTIQVGQTVTFTGTGTDPEPNLPLTHRWTFGAGSGIADRTVEDPGAITFTTAGVFTVTYTVTDALGLTDPTPATVQVTVSGTPPPSSLTISNLTVASGQSYIVPASGLQAGGTVYIDRAYTFTTVPASVQGATYIRTANNDKTATTPTFLSFTVNQPVSVLVAHDVRLTPKPSWLSTFTDTGTNLVTSDTSLRLFSRSFPAGTITLGGNASGGSGSMYAVIIQPQGGGGPVNQAPNGVINTPSGAQTIQVGQTVTFTGTGTDPEPNLPLTHRWTFGAGSGIADRTVEDPGAITFTTAGVFTVTYTVTDALGLTDPTPATVQVTVSGTPPPSSLTISNLTVASGQSYIVPASGLQAGGTVYIDRAYTFTTVPASVQGATYIRTANNDKTATTPTFLSFTVNQPVSVLVAHDVRLTPKPSWLSTFTDTGTNLVTSDTSLRLFSRSFPAGTITLGGNASGGSGSMYAVIVQQQSPPQ
ncbi:PKD domain-containing protein [Candidatus Nitrospira allomarina]|uniref:PKD domain-containing protein n=1 Tax=Candidatus Nitrospira allomarina TaxID=3020900 RepID=A0AA96JS23_9BACT|nr:PKD domain-containing protein [Candidatus Nitrospira allomarina]WNM58152.1 PKD domain-containing protein [Candidatus Nitrospira allomarina]